MRRIVVSAAFAAFPAALMAVCLAMPASAQDHNEAVKADAPKADSVNPDDIIRKFAAKEEEFRKARENYTYRQTVKMEELDAGGNPSGGKWEEIEDIIFSPDGKRAEKVIYAPVQSLQYIVLTPDDIHDLRDVQPFVLTTSDIGEYEIKYIGRDKIDEVGTYTFSVKPKKLEKGKRYFEGQIWVDDRDLQIVKTFGKGVGIRKGDDAFPKFETYREQIDGKYWFPTYTHADDTLHFKTSSQRIRMTVRYQDYKRFEGRSTIKFGDVVDDKNSTSTNPPTKKK